MSKAEKAFWAGLLLASGMVIGALLAALTQTPKKPTCFDGTTEEIKDGVRIKTYLPALDECKGQK